MFFAFIILTKIKKGALRLKIRKSINIFLMNIFFLSSAQIIWAGGEVTISHYFSGELGKANFMKGVKKF